MLGKLLGTVLKIANAPVRVTEAVVDVALREAGATKEMIGLSDVLEDAEKILVESLKPETEEDD